MQKIFVSLAFILATGAIYAEETPQECPYKGKSSPLEVRQGAATYLDNVKGKRSGQAAFDTIIAENKNVIVDFYADWCGPCKKMSTVIDQLAAKYPAVVFLKINIDNNPDLAEKFNIRSIPTVLYYKDNKQIKRTSSQSLPEMRSNIESIFN